MGKTPGEIARLTDNGQACEAHVRKVLETGRELSMEQIFTTKDGHDRRFRAILPGTHPAGQVTSVLFVARDMTEVYEYQVKIHSLAYFDTLTGLPNRLHFNERIASDLARAKLGRYPLSVLILDLDRFKTINDTLGHIAGDQLLCEVARRLAACVRETDCVARLGGDEFTIILPHVNSAAEIAQIANNILAVVSEPILIEGRELVTSMSIGVATYPADGSTESELIRSADAALYGAKSAGRNNVQFHTEKLTASNEARLNVKSICARESRRTRWRSTTSPKWKLLPVGWCGRKRSCGGGIQGVDGYLPLNLSAWLKKPASLCRWASRFFAGHANSLGSGTRSVPIQFTLPLIFHLASSISST